MDAKLPAVLAAAVASTAEGDCYEVATELRKACETANTEGNNQLAQQLDVVAPEIVLAVDATARP